MTQKKIIIFMPSIEGGGVEKNLFIISNFFANKLNNVSLITENVLKNFIFSKVFFMGAPSEWSTSLRIET